MSDYTETLDDALELWGEELQIDVAIEELSELITELAMLQRGTRNRLDNEYLIDEIADVQIILDQLKRMSGPSAVEKRTDEKLNRLQNRIEADRENRKRREQNNG